MNVLENDFEKIRGLCMYSNKNLRRFVDCASVQSKFKNYISSLPFVTRLIWNSHDTNWPTFRVINDFEFRKKTEKEN